MGIGNTTTSSAVASVLLQAPVEIVTGRGAGLSNAGLEKKIEVIKEAIALHHPDPEDPLAVLEAVGGFDIAGMCGLMLGGAIYRIPVVLDGLISLMAALLARKFCPLVTDFLLPSHMGKEPACGMAMETLGPGGKYLWKPGTGRGNRSRDAVSAAWIWRRRCTGRTVPLRIIMSALIRVLKNRNWMKDRKQRIQRSTVLGRRNRYDLFYRSRTGRSGTDHCEGKTSDR